MKKITIILLSIIFFYSCAEELEKQNIILKNKNDSLILTNNKLESRIKFMSDTLKMLSYPASDRLAKIKKLVEDKKTDEATKEISSLKILFPFSEESAECDKQESIISNIIEKQKAEEERIKALGYKVFKDNMVINLDGLKVSFSNFRFGRTFTFGYTADVDEYSYINADKDNTYILASMTLISKSKSYVSTPNLSVYEINDGFLNNVTYFKEEYSTWESYGAKIGNYSDDSHDFYKVNTVRYNIAAEVKKSLINKPLVILTGKNAGILKEKLSIEEVKEKCIVIKIINRNKL